MKKTLLAVLVFGAATTAVQANQTTGYVTGNIGQSDAKGFRNNTDTGYKIAVGLQANEYVAVEAQYIDLGKAKDKLWAARASSETKGIGANLVGTLPNDTYVTVEGYIVQQQGRDKEKYLFKDATGEILVEIDDKLWKGQAITPETKVKVLGELDQNRNPERIKIDAVYIEATQ